MVRTQSLCGLLACMAISITANAQDKPNILVIWGDDVGQSNISAYTMGLMGTGPRTSIASRKRA